MKIEADTSEQQTLKVKIIKITKSVFLLKTYGS